MELIEVINSSLIIFFSFISVTATCSYISYKIKDRTRTRDERTAEVDSVPVSGIYPRMLVVNNSYKIPGKTEQSVVPRRLRIFRNYSFNLSERLHKIRLTAK